MTPLENRKINDEMKDPVNFGTVAGRASIELEEITAIVEYPNASDVKCAIFRKYVAEGLGCIDKYDDVMQRIADARKAARKREKGG